MSRDTRVRSTTSMAGSGGVIHLLCKNTGGLRKRVADSCFLSQLARAAVGKPISGTAYGTSVHSSGFWMLET